MIRVLFFLFFSIAGLAFAGCADDGKVADVKLYASVTTADLNGVWGFSSSNVWAVGTGGTILHFDGVDWSQVEIETDASLEAIWGPAPDDVWVAGTVEGGAGTGTGVVLHYDGSNWSEVYDAATPLHAVGGVSDDDVYVTGMGQPLHWGGEDWASVDMTGAQALEYTNIWACTADSVFISDLDGVHYYDGVSWTTIAQGWISSQAALDVWAVSSSEAFIAAQGGVMHWDGAQWVNDAPVQDTMLTSIFGSGTTMCSLGYSYAEGSEEDPVLLVHDGTAWSQVDTGSVEVPVADLWAASGGEYFSVGDAGKIARIVVD